MSSKFLVRAATGVAAASAALLLATPGLASASTASPEHGGSEHGGPKYLKVICVNGERPDAVTLGRDGGDDGWSEPGSGREDGWSKPGREDRKGSDEYDGHYKSEKQYKKDGKNVLVQKTTIITCGDVAVSQSAAQDHSASASAAGSISLCADVVPTARVAQCAEESTAPAAPRGSVAGGDGGASGTNSGLAAGGSGALAAAAALGTVLLRRRTSAVAAA